MRHLPATLAVLVASATPCFGQAIWTGPPGGGMLGVQEPFAVGRWHGATGVVMDNYDRNPWGLDINELRGSFRLGLGGRWELYGSYYFTRAVTIPGGQHPAPTAPMDIIVASGQAPTLPYRSIYWPIPYVGQSSSAVGDMIPGDYLLGFKRQLTRQRGASPALSLSANIIYPGSFAFRHLHRGSGATSADGALHASAGWKIGRQWTLAGNLGYIRSGSPARLFDDNIITADGTTSPVHLKRPDFVRTAFGARYQRSTRLAWLAELYHLGAIGPRTPSIDSVGATDALLGLEITVRRFTLTAGIRQHMFSPPDHALRPTGQLSGAVDLTGVATDAQQAYLASIGVSASDRNPERSLVVTGAPADIPLPEGARRLPDTYVTRTKGNVGTIFLVGFRF